MCLDCYLREPKSEKVDSRDLLNGTSGQDPTWPEPTSLTDQARDQIDFSIESKRQMMWSKEAVPEYRIS